MIYEYSGLMNSLSMMKWFNSDLTGLNIGGWAAAAVSSH
jgi:hypothetical protein